MATDTSDQNVVRLQTSLHIDGKPFLVTLTEKQLLLEPSSHKKSTDSPSSEPLFKLCQQVIECCEIVAVCQEKSPPKEEKCTHIGGHSEICCTCMELSPLHPSAFALHYVSRQAKHKWRVKKMIFQCADPQLCQQWIGTIQTLLNSMDDVRPRKLLVFVNPFGGKRKGPKIYREKIAPLFDLAGVKTDIIITERAGHARKHIEQSDLSSYDGLICVGGDGMFSELLNGLLDHTQRDHHVQHSPNHHPVTPKIRIGIIPAGSTNTVVYTSTGVCDPVTSALHVIIGDRIGIDVTGVFHENRFVTYNVSMLAYGFYGDVLVDSENHRWMGPKRYDWCGFKKVMSNRGYEGVISYLPADSPDNTPRDGTRCLAGCSVCKESKQNYEKCFERHLESGDAPSDSSQDWQSIQGTFVGINSFVMSCRCALSPEGAAPSCHLGDGCADLAIITHGSRLGYARHLYRCTSKKADQFDLPYVQVHRVKEFSFRCKDDTEEGRGRPTSVWNCDGEVVPHANISVKIYCQLVNLFARGLEEAQRRDTREMTGCTAQCV